MKPLAHEYVSGRSERIIVRGRSLMLWDGTPKAIRRKIAPGKFLVANLRPSNICPQASSQCRRAGIWRESI